MKYFLISISILLSSFSYAQETLIFSGGEKKHNPTYKISRAILKEAYQRIGMNISFAILPASRGLKMSSNGVLDGEMHKIAGIDKNNKNLIMIPVPINKIDVVAFVKNPNITINSAHDLIHHKIGVEKRMKFADELTQGLDVEKATSIKQLFLMLDKERLDVVVTVHIAGLHTIKELHLEGAQFKIFPLQQKKMYHYLHFRHQAVVPRITETLKTMEEQGLITQRYKQVIAKASSFF